MGPSWESKSIKNRSQNEVNLGRHLGTDFSSILVGFGSQVGRENRAKRGQDRPRQRKRREAKGREGKGRGREGIGRERCGKVRMRTFSAGGGRGSPDL